MQYEAKTPEEYLGQLEDDWRKEKLTALRDIISDRAPGLTEEINYKMLGYRDGEGFVLHLNAQKNYVSLYRESYSNSPVTGPTRLSTLGSGR